MLKRIFVPLENSSSIDSVIKHACFIAKNQDAVVTAALFFNIPGVETRLGTLKNDKIVWLPEIKKEIIADTENIIIHLINKFKKECENNNVEYLVAEEIGLPIHELGEIIKYYDIVVTEFNSEFRIKNRKFDSNYLHTMLNYGVTPILAVPPAFKEINNILITYDASTSAARALQRFARIANFYQFNIKILMSQEDSDFGIKHLSEAKNLLKAYGATNVNIEITQKEIISALNSLYDFQPDLIVIGLHSKKFLHDYFIGSVTKHLIEKADIPLFIGI